MDNFETLRKAAKNLTKPHRHTYDNYLNCPAGHKWDDRSQPVGAVHEGTLFEQNIYSFPPSTHDILEADLLNMVADAYESEWKGFGAFVWDVRILEKAFGLALYVNRMHNDLA